MLTRLKKMCLLVFVFDGRSKKKKITDAGTTEQTPLLKPKESVDVQPHPRVERSKSVTLFNTPPVSALSPSQRGQDSRQEASKLSGSPAKAIGEVSRQPKAGCAQAELGEVESDLHTAQTDAMYPHPGSPLRPYLGHRWTSNQLRMFQHPFLPPPDNQVSLVSSLSSVEPPGETDTEAPHISSEASDRTTISDLSTPAVVYPSCRRLRDDDVSIFTLASSTSGFSIGPSIASQDKPDAQALEAMLAQDDASISSFEEITHEEAAFFQTPTKTQQQEQEFEASLSSFEEISHEEATPRFIWNENGDRVLCVLWLFTPYSLNTIATIMIYAAERQDRENVLTGEDARRRIVQLMREDSSRAPSSYGDMLRAFAEKPDGSSTKCLQAITSLLERAWAALQADLTRAAKDGAKKPWRYRDPETCDLATRKGIDRLSDEGLAWAGLPPRRWSRETREHLRELAWTGLRGGVERPREVGDVAAMSLGAECVALRVASRKGGKRGSWRR